MCNDHYSPPSTSSLTAPSVPLGGTPQAAVATATASADVLELVKYYSINTY